MLKLLLKLLKLKKLSQANKTLILNYLLEGVEALPINDVISYNAEGTILVNGQELTVEQAMRLREGAVALKNNWASNLIEEQIKYEAVKYGVHSSLTFDMLYMSKAAIWIQEQRKRLINEISV